MPYLSLVFWSYQCNPRTLNPKGTKWGLYRPQATSLVRHFFLDKRFAMKFHEFVTNLVIYNVPKGNRVFPASFFAIKIFRRGLYRPQRKN